MAWVKWIGRCHDRLPGEEKQVDDYHHHHEGRCQLAILLLVLHLLKLQDGLDGMLALSSRERLPACTSSHAFHPYQFLA